VLISTAQVRHLSGIPRKGGFYFETFKSASIPARLTSESVAGRRENPRQKAIRGENLVGGLQKRFLDNRLLAGDFEGPEYLLYVLQELDVTVERPVILASVKFPTQALTLPEIPPARLARRIFKHLSFFSRA
jgi:hypothetical protein